MPGSFYCNCQWFIWIRNHGITNLEYLLNHNVYQTMLHSMRLFMLFIESQKYDSILRMRYPYVYSFDKYISLSVI